MQGKVKCWDGYASVTLLRWHHRIVQSPPGGPKSLSILEDMDRWLDGERTESSLRGACNACPPHSELWTRMGHPCGSICSVPEEAELGIPVAVLKSAWPARFAYSIRTACPSLSYRERNVCWASGPVATETGEAELMRKIKMGWLNFA